jgi:hypothetical protein
MILRHVSCSNTLIKVALSVKKIVRSTLKGATITVTSEIGMAATLILLMEANSLVYVKNPPTHTHTHKLMHASECLKPEITEGLKSYLVVELHIKC